MDTTCRGFIADHMHPTEALSARDIAIIYPDVIDERNARRLLRNRLRLGETGFAVDGGPIKVAGTWLATLAWWKRILEIVDSGRV